MADIEETAEGIAALRWVHDNPPEMDPHRGDNGYPSTIEEVRIRNWTATDPKETMAVLLLIMEYVHARWSYPEYWEEHGIEEHGRLVREYTFSTGGWSGNEQLVSAMENNLMLHAFAPYSWQRGGHYVYRLPLE